MRSERFFWKESFPDRLAIGMGRRLLCRQIRKNVDFFMAECHGFVPYMQLCVCYDKMGCPEQAFFFHKKAKGLKPEDPGVLYDQKYFWEKYGLV